MTRELSDLRSISTLDYRTVTASVRNTGLVVVTHEAARQAAQGAQLKASVTELCFNYMEAAPERVSGRGGQRCGLDATVSCMIRHIACAALVAAATAIAATSAQTPARRVNLTGTVVAVNQQSDSVTLIDLKTMEAYRHVPVVGGPHEAAASPDGRSVLVTNYNKQGVGQQKTLSLLALPSGDTIKTIDLGEYRAPHDVRWVDPTHVVVTSEANQALLLVNVTTGTIERVFRTEAGVSHMLALTTDRSRIYCSNMRDGSVSAFDFKTGEKIKDVKTGKECEGVGVTPDGRWVWAGNRAEDTISVIDTKSLEVVKHIPSKGFPYRVQFTPDGRFALIPHAQASSLVVADVATQAIVKSIKLGLTKVAEPSTAGVFPHPDNRHAFVTVRNDNSMLVLDLVTGETLARVEVQSSPDGVTYSRVQR